MNNPRFSTVIAWSLAILTLITFIIAFLATPISGPFCPGNCIDYPYHNIIDRFPRDYWWMYPAMVLTLLYLVLMACIFQYAQPDKKVYGLTGLAFAVISAMFLVMDYFVQVSVIQPSLLRGETEGIALLTQYNPHGVFIAMEEAGYLMMSLSFLCMALIFSGTGGLERAIRWIFLSGFILTILSLILVSWFLGLKREYIFEVTVISIDWTVLIVSGFLLGWWFPRKMLPKTSS